MKITKTRLKQIIKEELELENLVEVGEKKINLTLTVEEAAMVAKSLDDDLDFLEYGGSARREDKVKMNVIDAIEVELNKLQLDIRGRPNPYGDELDV